MTRPLRSLPDNPDELRAFAEALQSRNRVLEDEVYAKTLHIEHLKAQLAALRRARFGRSSEKLDRDIEQLELAIGELEEAKAENDASRTVAPEGATVAAKAISLIQKEKGVPVRKALPEHLPRERIDHPAVCTCPACGGSRLSCIGTDEREVLEYVPSHFKIIVHARPKMSCRDCETITQPCLPSLPIDRGIPGPGLLARVITAKYCDHLPLYRQSVIYARQGVDIERSTMADWVGRMTYLLKPLAEAIGDHVRSGQAIHADDTPMPVLDPGRKQTKTGRLWVAVRDERTWGSTVPPAVYYQYAPDRRRERAAALLQGCRGYLHADAYSGFKHLYEPGRPIGTPGLKEVGCWAHARRYLYDVHEKTKSPRAKELLVTIAGLFAIEEQIRGRRPEERLAVRLRQSVPILTALKVRFDETLGQVSAKLTLAEAIRYSTSRWTAMTRFVEDGRLEMTNNAAERAIRPIAIGRNNWTFAGSDAGGERAALMYTLIETAKLNGLDPEAYLRQVIGCIADHPAKRIAELLPWNIGQNCSPGGT
ncbi:MAG: IS66 family transposase [Rhodomicrobium sp.]